MAEAIADIRSLTRAQTALAIRTLTGVCAPRPPSRAFVLSPEILETAGRQLGVSHGVLDVAVAEVGLKGTGIMALVGQREAARVPEHVRVNFELEASRRASALDKASETRCGERRAAL